MPTPACTRYGFDTIGRNLPHVDDLGTDGDPYGAPVCAIYHGRNALFPFTWLATSYDEEGRVYGYCVNEDTVELSEHGTIWCDELHQQSHLVVCSVGLLETGQMGLPIADQIRKYEDRARALQVAARLNREMPQPPKGTRGQRVGDYFVSFRRSYPGNWGITYKGK